MVLVSLLSDATNRPPCRKGVMVHVTIVTRAMTHDSLFLGTNKILVSKRDFRPFSRREPPVLFYPPQLSKGCGENFPRKKNICHKLRFQVALLSQLIPRLFVLSLFLRIRVNNWNWKWNKTKNRNPCIHRRTWKIHKEKNEFKCQNRTWKLIIAIPGVWRKSMLRVYGCMFCSISLLSVYMCVRVSLSSRSTAGVPSSRALPHFPLHTTCVP